jgi:hypoxanthine phosphoribosyltransferase
MEYLPVGWEKMYRMCIDLAKKIKKARFHPDIIIGMARGGWIPSRLISDLLHNKNLFNIRVEFYDDISKTKKAPRITQVLSVPIKNNKALIVDDVSDTGSSLLVVYNLLKKKSAASIKTATLHYKPHSIFKPDFYVKETTAWVVYPHERFEFFIYYIKNNRGKGYTLKDILDQIEKIGFTAPHIKQLVTEAWNISEIEF